MTKPKLRAVRYKIVAILPDSAELVVAFGPTAELTWPAIDLTNRCLNALSLEGVLRGFRYDYEFEAVP
jgi:hypothetical protein